MSQINHLKGPWKHECCPYIRVKDPGKDLTGFEPQEKKTGSGSDIIKCTLTFFSINIELLKLLKKSKDIIFFSFKSKKRLDRF